MFPDSDEAPSFWARALAVAAVVAAVLVNRHPQWALNDWVRGLAGHPAYRGPWLLIEHILLSGSVIFLVSLIAWHLAAVRGALPPPPIAAPSTSDFSRTCL